MSTMLLLFRSERVLSLSSARIVYTSMAANFTAAETLSGVCILMRKTLRTASLMDVFGSERYGRRHVPKRKRLSAIDFKPDLVLDSALVSEFCEVCMSSADGSAAEIEGDTSDEHGESRDAFGVSFPLDFTFSEA